MIEIIPAIIPQNLSHIREQLVKVSGLVQKIQIDVIDGQYAPVKTWPFISDQFNEIIKITRGEEKFPYIDNFILEIDMLVKHPIEYLNDFVSLGAKSFVIHIDSTDHIKECLETIKNSHCLAGLGIKPSGDIALLESFLPETDFVQFMGNDRIGYNGVNLDKDVLQKIKDFHKNHSSVPIQIDIGVSKETVSDLKSAGVSRFVSNSAIFNSSNTKEALLELQSL